MKNALLLLMVLNIKAWSQTVINCDTTPQQYDRCLTIENKSEQADCLEGVARYIQEICIKRRELTYRERKDILLDTLKDKFNGATDEEKASISNVNQKISQLNRINDSYKPKYESQTRDISDFSALIRDDVKPTFDTFKQQFDVFVSEAENATTSMQMGGIKHNLRTLIFKETSAIRNYLAETKLYKTKLQILQQQYTDDITPLSTTLDDEQLVKVLAFNVDVLNDIEQYLKNRYDLVKAKEDQLFATMSQKTNALLSQETQVVVNTSLQNSIYLRRSSNFLNEVTEVIVAFRSTQRSGYSLIPFQGPKWNNTKALLNLIALCESNDIEHWQSLGCHNALQEKSKAERVISSTIVNGIKFGVRAIRRLGDNTPQVEMLNHIEELLTQNRVEEAAYFFDDVLRAAEALQ